MNVAATETPQVISKKELLAQTGISYGQLYRWKREGLIPEEWFEKRSAFTGQETFLPRELALERVRVIQSMKDDLSLSEIRERIASMQKEASLKQMLLAVSDMSEDFLKSLTVELEHACLSECSIKAIATLYAALEKAGVTDEKRSTLISQSIALLGFASTPSTGRTPEPSSTDESRESRQQTEHQTTDVQVIATTEADTTSEAEGVEFPPATRKDES